MVDFNPHIDAPGVDSLEFEALIPLYEQALASDAGDIVALAWLAHAYTAVGRHEDGLALDLRLTVLLPEDPTARYNLGCSYALLGRTEEALAALDEAVDAGYRDSAHMLADQDLASLRDLTRFKQILDRLAELS